MKRIAAAGLCALALGTATLEAQVDIREAAPPPGSGEFKSPATLTFAIPSFGAFPPYSEHSFKGTLGSFINDAELQSLSLNRWKTKKGVIPLRLEGMIRVRTSHDKEVHIKATILAPDGRVLATASTKRFEAEERQQTRIPSLKLALPEQTAAALAPGDRLKLELLINVYGPGS